MGYSDHGCGEKGDGEQYMSRCSSQQSPDQEPNAQPILSPPGKPTGSIGILGCNWQGWESHEWKEKEECFKIYTYLFFFYNSLFKDFFFFSWSIVHLQCCVSLKCTANWFSYTYTNYFSDSFPYRLLQSIEYSSLCYTVGPK